MATGLRDEVLEDLNNELDVELGVEFDAEEYFFVPYAILRPMDVVCLDAEGNYTRLTDRDGKCHILRKQFGHSAERLPKRLFFQTGRDCIVNLAYVKAIELADPKRFLFTLTNGRSVIASRIQSLKFRRTHQF